MRRREPAIMKHLLRACDMRIRGSSPLETRGSERVFCNPYAELAYQIWWRSVLDIAVTPLQSKRTRLWWEMIERLRSAPHTVRTGEIVTPAGETRNVLELLGIDAGFANDALQKAFEHVGKDFNGMVDKCEQYSLQFL